MEVPLEGCIFIINPSTLISYPNNFYSEESPSEKYQYISYLQGKEGESGRPVTA